MTRDKLLERLDDYIGSELIVDGDVFVIKYQNEVYENSDIKKLWKTFRRKATKIEITSSNDSHTEQEEIEYDFRSYVGRKIKITYKLFNDHISSVNGIISYVKSDFVALNADHAQRAVAFKDIISYKLM